MKKVLFFWNGTINSALALHFIKQDPNIQIQALVVFLSEESTSIQYNGLPETLIVDQAKIMGLPLVRIFLPNTQSNLDENCKMIQAKLEIFKKAKIDTIIFGDLPGTLSYETNLKWARESGFNSEFPLTNKSENELLKTFFSSEYRAIVTAINLEKLDSHFLNKEFTPEWLASLPPEISKLANNDEFFTVTTFGPLYKMRLNYSKSIASKFKSYLVTLLKGP